MNTLVLPGRLTWTLRVLDVAAQGNVAAKTKVSLFTPNPPVAMTYQNCYKYVYSTIYQIIETK